MLKKQVHKSPLELFSFLIVLTWKFWVFLHKRGLWLFGVTLSTRDPYIGMQATKSLLELVGTLSLLPEGCGFPQESLLEILENWKQRVSLESWRQPKCQSPPRLFNLILGAQVGRWGLYFQNLTESDNQVITKNSQWEAVWKKPKTQL